MFTHRRSKMQFSEHDWSASHRFIDTSIKDMGAHKMQTQRIIKQLSSDVAMYTSHAMSRAVMHGETARLPLRDASSLCLSLCSDLHNNRDEWRLVRAAVITAQHAQHRWGLEIPLNCDKYTSELLICLHSVPRTMLANQRVASFVWWYSSAWSVCLSSIRRFISTINQPCFEITDKHKHSWVFSEIFLISHQRIIIMNRHCMLFVSECDFNNKQANFTNPFFFVIAFC